MRNGIKVISIVLLGCSLAQFPAAAQNTSSVQIPAAAPAAAPDTFTNLQERASYGVGIIFGNQLKRGSLDVNMDVLIGAMKDALAGRDLKLSEQQAQQAAMAYQQQRQHEVAVKNAQEGEAFLAENKKKEGIKTLAVTLPDSKTAELQYKVINEGAGESPKSSDTVSINFRGTLINGKEWDSTARRGQPMQISVSRSPLRGLTEVLPMMKIGSKWELYLPSSLAFGDRGGVVEPGAAVIFEAELVSIAPPPAAPPVHQGVTPPSVQPTTSDIIKVPSADEMKAGKKIEVIKAADAEKMAAEQSKTNKPATNNPTASKPAKKKK